MGGLDVDIGIDKEKYGRGGGWARDEFILLGCFVLGWEIGFIYEKFILELKYLLISELLRWFASILILIYVLVSCLNKRPPWDMETGIAFPPG